MPFSEILYEVADGVCTVTLNRPDRLNAVTTTMIRELGEAWSAPTPTTPFARSS